MKHNVLTISLITISLLFAGFALFNGNNAITGQAINSLQGEFGLQGSCQNSCGGTSADGCFCDNACEQYGDCCADYKNICSKTNIPRILKCDQKDIVKKDDTFYLQGTPFTYLGTKTQKEERVIRFRNEFTNEEENFIARKNVLGKHQGTFVLNKVPHYFLAQEITQDFDLQLACAPKVVPLNCNEEYKEGETIQLISKNDQVTYKGVQNNKLLFGDGLKTHEVELVPSVDKVKEGTLTINKKEYLFGLTKEDTIQYLCRKTTRVSSCGVVPFGKKVEVIYNAKEYTIENVAMDRQITAQLVVNGQNTGSLYKEGIYTLQDGVSVKVTNIFDDKLTAGKKEVGFCLGRATCSESDKGINPYKKGTLNGIHESCTNEYILEETYCDMTRGDKENIFAQRKTTQIDCRDYGLGCSEGACREIVKIIN